MSFFEDTWGLPEFFDPQEELEFLDLPDEDFFDIPADNNQELDALLTTNSEDQSINNESLSEDLEVNRANVLGTRETLRVDPDAMVYETHTEIEKLETESAGPNTGSHSNIQVETQVQDSPVRAVNSQSLQVLITFVLQRINNELTVQANTIHFGTAPDCYISICIADCTRSVIIGSSYLIPQLKLQHYATPRYSQDWTERKVNYRQNNRRTRQKNC